MTRNVIACGLLSCFSLLLTAFATHEAVAQDTVLSDLYGHGVHSYYRGDFAETVKALETVVDEGTSDPRVYYFLGLAEYQQGDQEKAFASFTKGAELELDGTQVYPIGKSLERVQGPARLVLEDYREKVRTQIYLKKKEQEKSLFEAKKMAEEQVLRSRAEQASRNVPVDVPAEDSTDPFGSPGAAEVPEMPAPVDASELPAEEPPAAAEDAESNPFGTQPMPEVDAADTNPFGDQPTDTPTANPFATESPAGMNQPQ